MDDWLFIPKSGVVSWNGRFFCEFFLEPAKISIAVLGRDGSLAEADA